MPHPGVIVGNMAMLPIRTKYRGPAPLMTSEGIDVIDEALQYFKANVFFRTYEVKVCLYFFFYSFMKVMIFYFSLLFFMHLFIAEYIFDCHFPLFLNLCNQLFYSCGVAFTCVISCTNLHI